jgi:hypothetical protein
MNDIWYFDREGAYASRWIWRRVAGNGCVVDASRSFPYYLDALRDAKAHGFSGRPEFGKPPLHAKRDR